MKPQWQIRIIDDPSDPCPVPDEHADAIEEGVEWFAEHGPFDDLWGLDCGCVLVCERVRE